jgi:hypothetical protein
MNAFRVIYFLLIAGFLLTNPSTAASQGIDQPEVTYTVGEGNDFATRVLGDPWDMQQFTDVSQWLNHTTNPAWDLANIQVYSGVFSALTLGNYSEFFPLFPGYEPGMNEGKIGALHPISSSQYSCLYLAMYSSWPTSDYNYFTIFWAPDRQMWQWVDPAYTWGIEGANNLIKNQWRLYQVDLAHPDYLNGEPWTYLSQWQALRITPSLQPDTQFYIDWVRLTDCQPVWVELTGLPAGAYNLWVGWGSPERQILAVSGFSPDGSGHYAWDVQGLEPGTYTYYVKDLSGGLVQQGQLTIKPTPIVRFTTPSQYSGQDYATSNGNAWDIDPTDTPVIDCASWAFINGVLLLDTLPPEYLPDGCRGLSPHYESDPRIFLNTPDHGNLSAYRYLSFSARMDGSLSLPEQGMIVRLFWRLDRPGYLGEDCWYTSRAIPLEIGWHGYYADLYDPRNGYPEEVSPSNCPMVSWLDQASVGPLVDMRWDPNENITHSTFHQEFDWIRLTQVEQVHQGQPLDVRYLVNIPLSELSFLDIYYTTDINQPTQHPALRYTAPQLDGPYFTYIPLQPLIGATYDRFRHTLPADGVYMWDTSSVSPGIYYLCAIAGDGYTYSPYCSPAPVQVLAP